MNDGSELEDLVTALESAVADQSSVSVQRNQKFRDSRTNRLRQFDVVVTIRQVHHLMKIALECKDRSRPIGVEHVEAFQMKIEDCGLDQGIIVSRKGFFKTARTKADSYGIRCFDVENAKQFSWIPNPEMEQMKVEIKNLNHTLAIAHEVKLDFSSVEFIDRNGDTFQKDTLMTMLNQVLRPHVENMAPAGTSAGSYPAFIRLNTPGLRVRDGVRDIIYEVDQIHSTFEVKVSVRFVPFSLSIYSDKGQNLLITESASVPMTIGDISGTLVWSHRENTGHKVSFIRKKMTKKKKA